MIKKRYIKLYLIFILVLNINLNELIAQCNPPPGETCNEAGFFCSLDQMNGYSCQNTSMTLGSCNSGCLSVGNIWYRNWWAFISQGGNVSITLHIGSCSVNVCFPGLVMGIFGDCSCSEEIMCIPYYMPPNQSETYQVNLKPCKIYYLWIDACGYKGDDICDFTLSTSGGAPPNLFLGHINNINNDIIEPVCQGYCGYKFFVDQGGCLEANYEWTLDGNKVGSSKADIKLDFPDAGDFKLCVTASLGNPNNGALCAMQGPTCTTVKVRALPDRKGVTRTICNEAAIPKGYKWQSQTIFTSGAYREHYKDNNCCPYDSVVQFRVLDKPVPPDVYYITCNNVPYVDALGRRWSPCRAQEEIVFPKSTDVFKCDSSILLTAVNVDFAPQWKAQCLNGKVELSPNVNILKACDVGETYEFDYRWYKQNDTLQKTISTDEKLLVEPADTDYCLDVKVKVRLGTATSICTKTFCDTIHEANAKNTIQNLKLLYCDSAVINGQTYLQSSQFTQQLKNVFGCDSVVNTEISIQKSGKSDLSFKSCDSVVVNGISYTQSGIYIQVLQNANLCDSILNIDVSIQKSSITNIAQTDCDSIAINGISYTQSGMYTQSLKSTNFCDSIIHLDLTILTSSKTAVAFNACDSFTINGKNYYQSLQFDQLLLNASGCDSIVNTDLIITKSSSSDLVQHACDSTTINNQVYTQSGVYKQILTNATNCDSIINLQLTIGKTSGSSLTLTTCDSAIINGQVYMLTGVYKQLLANASGCDSILNLDLTIAKGSTQDLYFNACDSVLLNGKIYTKSGDYPQTFISANGCDSIINVHVNITNSNASPYIVSSCDSALINNTLYKQSGNYTQLLKSANGCDSTLNIELTIAKSNSSNYNYSACDSALINGQKYLLSGNYIQTLQNEDHCDSSLTINLNIQKSTGSTLNLSSCDSVLVNGQIYNQSGIYLQKLSNANSCDSLLTIDYTRLSTSSSNRNMKSCDSVVVNGQVYNQSGNYIQKLVNANNCDSLLNLNIEVTKSNSYNYKLSSCDSAIINGQIYKQSGSYKQILQNVALCDSVLSIDLNLSKSSFTNYSLQACDSAVVNNQVYTLTGVYKQLLANASGCDSVLNLFLTISKSSISTLALTGCDSAIINNRVYTLTGVYKQILPNANGCDSTLTLDLTIKPGNTYTLDAGPDTSICDGQIIKLNGLFSGPANFIWHSTHGSFDNPHNLSTNYYPSIIGDDRIYLQAVDDCKQWQDSLAIHVLPKQIVQVTGDTILNPCKEITFTASGGTKYTWTPSSLIECLDPACSKVRLKSSNNLRYTITSDGPCVVPANLNLSLSELQTDIYLPNAFSPNGDNINDVFLPVFNCEQVDFYNLQIFDRWGNLIFESNNKDKGWNGKYQDVNMNPGVYPYVVQYQVHGGERKVKAGDVTLIK